MVKIKHFTAPQKMPNFQFSRRANWPWRDKILSEKIIVNRRKAVSGPLGPQVWSKNKGAGPPAPPLNPPLVQF